MDKARTIRTILKNKPTIEGAGVHLRRVFGNGEVPLFDPFLLLDDFRSGNPDHYLAGFPWHPHRGIETITYILGGEVEHGDSMGNTGVISPGDTQWMTAGSGIIHQEMPRGDNEGRMEGFQLWANLPKSHKMMEPRYRDVTSAQVPEVVLGNGVTIKIISGKVGRHEGPVKGIITDPEYLDVSIPVNSEFTHRTRQGHTVFAYVIGGQGYFDESKTKPVGNGRVCLCEDGDHITVATGGEPVRFLLISGKPIGEPVAWYGPIVMNTAEELHEAFEEYRNGTFIKHKKPQRT
ncbi:MAG: Pirin domain protein [Deltaproteobacteria bacterium]|nr:Pirin domain protein [Deltaproteobacteria bacterium]